MGQPCLLPVAAKECRTATTGTLGSQGAVNCADSQLAWLKHHADAWFSSAQLPSSTGCPSSELCCPAQRAWCLLSGSGQQTLSWITADDDLCHCTTAKVALETGHRSAQQGLLQARHSKGTQGRLCCTGAVCAAGSVPAACCSAGADWAGSCPRSDCSAGPLQCVAARCLPCAADAIPCCVTAWACHFTTIGSYCCRTDDRESWPGHGCNDPCEHCD